jgi:hypothetical protein
MMNGTRLPYSIDNKKTQHKADYDLAIDRMSKAKKEAAKPAVC